MLLIAYSKRRRRMEPLSRIKNASRLACALLYPTGTEANPYGSPVTYYFVLVIPF